MLANGDALLTVEQVAELLSLSPKTVRSYLARGQFERWKIFGATRISRNEALSHVRRDARTEWIAGAFTGRRGHV